MANPIDCAIVVNGVVENIVVFEAIPAAIPAGYPAGASIVPLGSSNAGIGWNYDAATGVFSNPNPPPPDNAAPALGTPPAGSLRALLVANNVITAAEAAALTSL